jgi:hypothetical protein
MSGAIVGMDGGGFSEEPHYPLHGSGRRRGRARAADWPPGLTGDIAARRPAREPVA